jgi:hypothetical protein
MSTATHDVPDVQVPDRAEMVTRTRAELRASHRRLTDRQIDLIAEVAVEIRLTSFRLLEGFSVTQLEDSAEH